ncbi:MAG: class I SAM-dependent methyltransferase [Microthrixaceae bacterium]
MDDPRRVRRSEKVSHPVFARLYNVFNAAAERSGAADHRSELLAGLSGRVVEVGAGTGSNFVHYPSGVELVVAIEPEPWMRARCNEAADRAPVPVEVRDGIDADLPVPDGWADAVVASLMLCSVHDVDVALAEMQRVVRPGGELRFYEHVRSADPRAARWQERVDVVWPKLAGGCHTSRDVLSAVERTGWTAIEHRDFTFSPGRAPNPVAPHTIGRAVKPATEVTTASSGGDG